ncbi:MAG: N-acetylmuramoyl-L-alanine amidase, partial [Chitinophagaceae bacterium]
MNSLLYYLLQVIISSGILYLYYHLALRNKKFHQYNRFYLLGATVVSILLPFLNIPVYFSQQETQSSFVLQTLTVLSFSEQVTTPIIAGASDADATAFNPFNLLYYAYALLATVILTRIIFSLVKIYRLRKSYPAEKIDNINFINTNDPSTPFSFFNWLFWNKSVELKSEKGEQVFRHELFHIKQRHSLDVIFMEIISMIFWINPFFHIIKKELRAIHEFLADQFAVHETEKWNYTETLLMHVLQTRQSLVNPFFHNQIKRRIAMITNSQKTSHRYLRKMLVLPVAAIVVTLFAFRYQSHIPAVLNWDKPITIVIDAGHGGTDPGVRSPDNKYTESELTLSLAKMIQKLAPEYDINVVMTRENADYPGGATHKDDGLRKRVEISNEINPTAFISLHINSDGGKDYQQKLSGIEAYVTNKRMDDPGKAAASAIIQELSQIYKTATDLKFREQSGVWVLDKSNSPTVLLECGYINNSEDLKFITDKNNQEKIARSILRGIVTYSKRNTPQGTATVHAIADSTPKNSYILKEFNIQLSSGFSIEGENITIRQPLEEDVASKSSKYELIVINGELFNLMQAQKSLDGMIIKSGELSLISAGNAEAIRKYGSNAKNGLMLLQNAIIVKKPIKNVINLKTLDSENVLLVIDGEIQHPNDPHRKKMKDLIPNDIESINVLKDKKSVEKYGEEGKNGVMEIVRKML